MIGWWTMAAHASVARLEPPCTGPQDCAERLEGRGLPNAARAVVVERALRGPGPGYHEALDWLVTHEDPADGPSDALEAVASGTDPQTWPTDLRSTLTFHRSRWLARNGHGDRAIRLLQGDDSQRALLLTGTLVGRSTSEDDRIVAVRMLAHAARHPQGDPDNRDLALVNAGRVLLTLDRPDLAWALFTQVAPDAAHGPAASRGALWCEVALGYGDLVQQRLEQLGTADAETLYLSGVLAAHEGRTADAQAARDALVALVDGEARVTGTVADLRGTVAWAAWEALRPGAPPSLQAHVDDRVGGIDPLDEVVAEFERVRHRPEVGPALRADLAQAVDRLGTQASGAAAARQHWQEAATHLSSLVTRAEAPSASSDPVHPLGSGRWGAAVDVADGPYAGPRPTRRTPDRVVPDTRRFGDPEPEPGHAGLTAQGGPHPLDPGHHLLRLTVAAPEGRDVELGVTFDGGSVVTVRRVGADAPAMDAVGVLRGGARASVLFDVELAEAPGDQLATVTLTARCPGRDQEWTFPLPVALVNPLEDAGDRRHLLIAALAGGVAGSATWDVLAGEPGVTTDVAALMEVIGDLEASEGPISWRSR